MIATIISRRLSVVSTMIVFALVFAICGCSSASHSTPALQSGAAAILNMPQSVGSWTIKTHMPTARAYLASGVVHGILYAIGGATCDTCTLNTVEAYDPATDTWATKASLPTARGALAGGVVDGIIYAVGGISANGYLLNTVEAYDPKTDTWTTKTPMPKERAFLAAGVVNGILYAVGGIDCTQYPTCGTKHTVFAYDPATDTWTEKAGMLRARKNLAVGVLNGILYVVGGNNYRGPLKELQAYNPATNTWSFKAPIPHPREALAAGVINGRLYAVGGCSERECRQPSTTVEAYDPGTNTWKIEASMPTARGFLAASVVGRTLYAVGGDSVFNPQNQLEAFNP